MVEPDWNDCINVVVELKSYFDEYSCMSDNHNNINDILPDSLWESMENVYSTDLSVEEIRTSMLERGFTESLVFLTQVKTEMD